MITSHLQSVTVGQFDVTLITLVDTVTTLRSLQIDIRHLGVLANGLPEHLTLIMRQIDTMHMTTGIFTHNRRIVVRIIQSRIYGLHNCYPTATDLLFLNDLMRLGATLSIYL